MIALSSVCIVAEQKEKYKFMITIYYYTGYYIIYIALYCII